MRNEDKLKGKRISAVNRDMDGNLTLIFDDHSEARLFVTDMFYGEPLSEGTKVEVEFLEKK
jgi:hypothetical protein